MTRPPDDKPTPPVPSIRPLAVIAGFILGSVGWLGLEFLSLVLPHTSSNGYWIFNSALTLTAITVAAGLLAYPRTRQVGAGLVLGTAAGVIIWAGVCLALVRF